MNSLVDLFDEEEKTPAKKWKKISGFMKIGKVFTLKNFSHSRNSVGDWECVKLLQLLANKEPDTKFQIISGCDLNKLHPMERKKMFPNENVFYTELNRKVDYKLRCWEIEDNRECEDVYIMAGPSGTRNGAVDFWKEDGSPYLLIEMNRNYVAPNYYFLNRFDKPKVFLVTDNRYFPAGFDFYGVPDYVISQFADESKVYGGSHKRIDGPDDINANEKIMTKYNYKIENARIETLWLYEKEIPNKFDFENRESKILIVANQVSSSLNKRYDLIKSYFVDTKIPCTLVGKWPNEIAKETFKNILYNEDGVDQDTLNNEILPSYKYGAIFNYDTFTKFENISSNESWVVVKFWEYIYHGIIPILFNYPKGFLNLPDYLYINNKSDLKNCFEKLNKLTDDERSNIIKSILKSEYFNGDYLYERIKEIRAKYE